MSRGCAFPPRPVKHLLFPIPIDNPNCIPRVAPRFAMLDSGFSMLALHVRCSMLDVGCWMFVEMTNDEDGLVLITDNAAVIPSREGDEGPFPNSDITQTTYRLLLAISCAFCLFHQSPLTFPDFSLLAPRALKYHSHQCAAFIAKSGLTTGGSLPFLPGPASSPFTDLLFGYDWIFDFRCWIFVRVRFQCSLL